MDDLLQQAAHCPVCDSLPFPSLEAVSTESFLSKKVVFLRCPKMHPYVICGDTLMQAINNWDHYIALRIQQDTQEMLRNVAKNVNSSYCQNCRKFTKAITTFEKVLTGPERQGYSMVKHECSGCHLIKQEKQAA